MKFLINVGITAVITILLGLMLPFWAAVIAGFLGGFFFNKSGGHDFWAGFVSVFIVWAGYGLLIMLSTGSPLPERLAPILKLDAIGPMALVLVSGIIGGLAGGLASLTGGHFRRVIGDQR